MIGASLVLATALVFGEVLTKPSGKEAAKPIPIGIGDYTTFKDIRDNYSVPTSPEELLPRSVVIRADARFYFCPDKDINDESKAQCIKIEVTAVDAKKDR